MSTKASAPVSVRPLPADVIERLSDLLAAAAVRDVRERLAQRERAGSEDR